MFFCVIYSKDNRKPTLVATMAGHKKLGQRRGMTSTDCLKINDLYGCLDESHGNKKYYRLCKLLGS